MKDYYKVLSHFYNKEKLEPIKNDQIKLIKLYNITRDAFPKNDPRWSDADPEQGRANYYGSMTVKKLKEYIKEVITNTLNEANLYKVTTNSGEETMPFDNDQEANNAKKYGNVKNVEKLEELEPNSKQKLKLANRELAFLAKQVKSLEKQIKSQGSNEDKG